MSNKTPQSAADLEQHLADHIRFLEDSASSYDRGFTSEAKRMAVSIRVLLHSTKSSKSLLGQIGKKDIKFYDTAEEYDPKNLLTFVGLVYMRGTRTGATFQPYLDDGPPSQIRQVDFDTWWNSTIIKDKAGNRMSRKDLITSVANQDGGAHVDPKLNSVYAGLSRHATHGWTYLNESGSQEMAGIEHASIRQITHELLKSLEGLQSVR